MKCDELKPLVFSLNELSFIDEHAVQKNFENPHDHAVYKATEVDAVIAELKQKLQDQCISCPVKIQEDDVVAEKDNEIRKLKRALWLSRGYIMTLLQRDFQRLAYQCNNGDYKKNLLNRRNRYYDLYEKCRAKEEEYK